MLFLQERIDESIEILRQFEPPDGYYLAFSGGKDSMVLYAMAEQAGVKFDAHYHITSADPPELVRFIRQHYPEVDMDRPEYTMWNLIPKKQWPPTRVQRYCCEYLKEYGGQGRIMLSGIRKTDSIRRRKTRAIRTCHKKGTTMISPLFNWCTEEIWEFIEDKNLPYCELYNQGFARLGCVGCPMAGSDRQGMELQRWPKFREAYLRAFARMLQERGKSGKEKIWNTAEEVMAWWLRESPSVKILEED